MNRDNRPRQRLLLFAMAILAITAPANAADSQVHRDLAYTTPKDNQRTLDLYAPAQGKDHPVLVWLHGGGWRQGDKAHVQRKPQAFVSKGFVFVSVNYRFVPQVTVKEMTGDIAKAIKWVHDHAKDYGGSPDRIFVAGHSAGAHLAALVCTDGRYLKAEGLPLSVPGSMVDQGKPDLEAPGGTEVEPGRVRAGHQQRHDSGQARARGRGQAIGQVCQTVVRLAVGVGIGGRSPKMDCAIGQICLMVGLVRQPQRRRC